MVRLLEFIKDKDVFKAVSFARAMHKKGDSMGFAVHKAAKYYGVSESEVAGHLGKLANKVKKEYKDYE